MWLQKLSICNVACHQRSRLYGIRHWILNRVHQPVKSKRQLFSTHATCSSRAECRQHSEHLAQRLANVDASHSHHDVLHQQNKTFRCDYIFPSRLDAIATLAVASSHARPSRSSLASENVCPEPHPICSESVQLQLRNACPRSGCESCSFTAWQRHLTSFLGSVPNPRGQHHTHIPTNWHLAETNTFAPNAVSRRCTSRLVAVQSSVFPTVSEDLEPALVLKARPIMREERSWHCSGPEHCPTARIDWQLIDVTILPFPPCTQSISCSKHRLPRSPILRAAGHLSSRCTASLSQMRVA